MRARETMMACCRPKRADKLALSPSCQGKANHASKLISRLEEQLIKVARKYDDEGATQTLAADELSTCCVCPPIRRAGVRATKCYCSTTFGCALLISHRRLSTTPSIKQTHLDTQITYLLHSEIEPADGDHKHEACLFVPFFLPSHEKPAHSASTRPSVSPHLGGVAAGWLHRPSMQMQAEVSLVCLK